MGVLGPRPRRVDPKPRLTREMVFVALGVAGMVFAAGAAAASGLTFADGSVYLAAGQRLNEGLPLYAPASNPTGQAPVAIFSPPLLAVLFRPIALVPFGLLLWGISLALAELGGLACILSRVPAAGLAVFVLAIPIQILLGYGNVDELILAGLVAVWFLMPRHDRAAGIMLGLLFSLKLTPATVIWWAVVTRRWTVVAASIATIGVLGLVTMLGSTPDIFLTYAQVTFANYGASAGTLSLGAIAGAFGVPPEIGAWLPRLALVVGLTSVWLLRNHRGGWAMAIATMVLASPVAFPHSPAILVAAFLPWAGRLAPELER